MLSPIFRAEPRRVTPPLAYPIIFWITLIATLVVGRAAPRSTKRWADTAPAIRDIPTTA